MKKSLILVLEVLLSLPASLRLVFEVLSELPTAVALPSFPNDNFVPSGGVAKKVSQKNDYKKDTPEKHP